MPPADAPLSLRIDPAALVPVIEATVREVLAQHQQASEAVPSDRLAYSEAEAARMLGLERHQLRDIRRRGEIAASTIVGRRVRYTRDDLVAYLAARRTPAA